MKKILSTFFLNFSLFGFQPVDINQASSEQIALLPGIGKTVAENLVSYRQRKGKLTNVNELLNVSGMTEKKLAALKGQIVFSSRAALQLKISPPELDVAPPPTLTTVRQRPVIDLASLEAKALKIMGLARDFEASMVKRARSSAWVPKLSFLGDIGRHYAATEKAKADKDDSINRTGNTFGFGVRASFDLPQLVFHDEELEVAKLALKRLEAREKLIAQLHKYYFRYVRLLENGKIPSTEGTIDQIKTELRELGAELDSLSDGEFSRFQGDVGGNF